MSNKNLRVQFWEELKAGLSEIGFYPIHDKAHTGNFVKFSRAMESEDNISFLDQLRKNAKSAQGSADEDISSQPISKFAKYDIHISEKKSGVQVSWSLDAWENKSDDENSHFWRKAFFQHILQNKVAVDSAFGEGLLEWDDSNKGRMNVLYKIKTPKHECNPSDDNEWDSILRFVKGFLMRFDKALNPVLLAAENDAEEREYSRNALERRAKREISFKESSFFGKAFRKLTVVVCWMLAILALTGSFYLPIVWWLGIIMLNLFCVLAWARNHSGNAKEEGETIAAFIFAPFMIWGVGSFGSFIYGELNPKPLTAEQIEAQEYKREQDIKAQKYKQQRVSCIISARSAVKKRLIEPNSAKFSSEYPCFQNSEGEWVQSGTVNSKNRFGGYAGARSYQVIMKDGKVLRVDF